MASLDSSYWPAPAPARITNAVMFNVSWLAIVLTQSYLLGPIIAIAHLLLHFRLVGRGRNELLLVVGVTMFGAIADQLLFRIGVFNIAGQTAWAPLWLTCLWPVFATTLMHAFQGFQQRVLLVAVVGGVGGALSYVAGVRLTDVEFGSVFWGPVIVGTLWAIVFPVLLKISDRLADQKGAVQDWTPAERRAFD